MIRRRNINLGGTCFRTSRRALFLLLLSVATSFGAFTEFYVTGTGSNLNAGSTTSDAALVTYTSVILAGGWNAATGVYTPASGNPVSDGVTTGMFASVYITAGATNATFVSRITAVSSTTITVSLTAVSGTPPVTDALGATTLKVGGAWAGPSGTSGFPFGFAAAAMVNTTGDSPRVNFKSGSNYAITAAMTHSLNGPMRFQGYTTTPGDLGKATVDGGTSGAGYTLLTISGTNNDIADFIFQNNGASGTGNGLTLSAAENTVRRVVANSTRTSGINLTTGASSTIVSECEAYGCNQSNTTANGGFLVGTSGGNMFVRCISHDNSGSSAHGFYISASASFIGCIADSNGGAGFISNASTFTSLVNCDAYNNGINGIDLLAASAVSVLIENCNLLKNGAYGINSTGSATLRNGAIANCAFGSGSQANASGDILTITGLNISGSITYASGVTPWVDPANGDFRVVLEAAKGTGRGNFTQTAASYTGTLAFPDIGAAQGTSLVPRRIPTIGD